MEAWLAPTLLILLVLSGILVFRQDARRDRDWVEYSSSPAHRPDTTVKAFTRLRANGVRCKLRSRRAAPLALGSAGYRQTLLVHQDDLTWARNVVPSSEVDSVEGA